MSRLTFSINVTIDGRCEHTQVVADDEHHEYVLRLLEGAGGVILGRNTYELFAAYWPDVARTGEGTAAEVAFARALEATPRYVVSRTLETAEWPGTTVLSGDLEKEITSLKAKATGDFVVFGSPGLGCSLAELNQIDEYHILVQPILAGTGPIVFERLSRRLDLALIDSRSFASGVVLARYAPKRRH